MGITNLEQLQSLNYNLRSPLPSKAFDDQIVAILTLVAEVQVLADDIAKHASQLRELPQCLSCTKSRMTAPGYACSSRWYAY